MGVMLQKHSLSAAEFHIKTTMHKKRIYVIYGLDWPVHKELLNDLKLT